MASKYFKSRALSKNTKYTPAGSSKQFNSPNISEKYTEIVNNLTMSLIKSGEGLLGVFNSSTVNSIPESIIPSNDEVTRLNDRTIPQLFKTASVQTSATKNAYLRKINLILASIRKKIVVEKKNNGSIAPYFGKIDPSSGTFYPGIIKYDANGNPTYDMRFSIDDSIGLTELQVRISHVP
jgi:hypothetical protein